MEIWNYIFFGILPRGTIETDLNDLRFESKIFDILGCAVTSHLHVGIEDPMCVIYLIPTPWFLLTGIRSEIRGSYPATRKNADTRLDPNEFFEHQSVSWEGRCVLRLLDYVEMVSEGAAAKNIQELQDLTTRRPIDRESGTTIGRISNQVIYGKTKCPKIIL